ncbi:MAG TPA: ATP-dependent Clp protease adaptor ClpS, partial [Acidimicrobiales bacterium]|nr:ATP-dependent Clp protease adaptor ClpS [Acidimicrobiales bacterium]
MSQPAPTELDLPTSGEDTLVDRPWLVIVWNDPINLMSYVTFVFQKLFGYSKEKATKLMLDV